MHDAATVPDEAVGADAEQHVAADRPAGDRHAVGAARHADIAADRPVRKDDRVVAEPGDEVAVDDAARHVEEIVGEFHRSEEHTSELPSLMRISYAVFCLKKKKYIYRITHT